MSESGRRVQSYRCTDTPDKEIIHANVGLDTCFYLPDLVCVSFKEGGGVICVLTFTIFPLNTTMKSHKVLQDYFSLHLQHMQPIRNNSHSKPTPPFLSPSPSHTQTMGQ